MVVTPYLRLGLSVFIALCLLVGDVPSDGASVQAAADKIDVSLRKEMKADPGKKLPIIVEMRSQDTPGQRPISRRADEAAALLDSLGSDGKRVGMLPIIGGAAGVANSRAIDRLGRDPNVAFVYADAAVQPRLVETDPLAGTYPKEAGRVATPYPIDLRANKAWQGGMTGRGVGVAVLDSGISAHEDLALPANRLVAAVNFAGDLGGMADAGGHGTHVAGVIAGNSTRVDLAGRQVSSVSGADASYADYVGVAPGANLIDVRVLDAQGNGRISSVIAGIQWVINNRARYNIRVINLSLGGPISASYRNDPLSAAVEIAWKRGIVVVAAAGNRGPNSGGVETPGIDPYAITVGSVDDQGTIGNQDNSLASFSSWGLPIGSTPKPDVVAPGRKVVSLRVPGSYLDRSYPDRVVSGRTGPNYFRLTGTSMSTAMVSGTVALMLERQPGLKPDQVKAILMGTTQLYGQNSSTALPNPAADGTGLINAYSAATGSAGTPANRGLRPADPFARALYPVLYGQTLTWKDPRYAGIDWNNLAWDNLAWDNLAWDNLAWDNLAWDNLAWDNLAWDNLAWDNLAWDNLAWDSKGGYDPTLD